MIDKRRTIAKTRPFFPADETATWEEGMVATLTTDAYGNIVATPVSNPAADVPVGIFYKPKTSAITKIEIEEVVVPVGVAVDDTINLSHANIVNGSEVVLDVSVTPAVQLTKWNGTTGDYDINYTNGTLIIKNTGLGGKTLQVTYRYSPSVDELKFQPVPFERVPDATKASGKITLIVAPAIIYTDQFDTSQLYNPMDALYVDSNGRLTSTNTGSPVIGRVISPPSLGDKWLGFKLLDV